MCLHAHTVADLLTSFFVVVVSLSAIMQQLFSFALFLLLSLSLSVYGDDANMPSPFYRVLQYQVPMMEGNDVFILQNLIKRSVYVNPSLQTDGVYGHNTVAAVGDFQV